MIQRLLVPADTRGSGGSASCTARTSTWSAPRRWISWTSCCATTTRRVSRPGTPWSTPTSVCTPARVPCPPGGLGDIPVPPSPPPPAAFPPDPIAKDPARLSTAATLSAANTPVSSSSMLAGESWPVGTPGDTPGPPAGVTPAPCVSPQGSHPWPRRSRWAAWPPRPSSPRPTRWARRSPPRRSRDPGAVPVPVPQRRGRLLPPPPPQTAGDLDYYYFLISISVESGKREQSRRFPVPMSPPRCRCRRWPRRSPEGRG